MQVRLFLKFILPTMEGVILNKIHIFIYPVKHSFHSTSLREHTFKCCKFNVTFQAIHFLTLRIVI